MIRGVVGRITWGYYQAATIEGYTVVGQGPTTARRWSLRGRLVLADPFKLSRRPLVFVAPTAKGTWRWPLVSLERIGDTVTAQLGPPMEDVNHHVALRPS